MLEISDLYAYYGDSVALNGLTLSVGEGRSVALLGRNGAGKSTLMKSIMGDGPRTAGSISFGSRQITALPPHQRTRLGLALVPEDRRIFSHLTVAENLLLARNGCRLGVPPLELDEVFQLFPLLRELRSRLGHQMSGGQQQILAVARGMVSQPLCLLLDEPTEGVAPIIVQQIARQVNEIRSRSGCAMLLAEQNIWFARECSEHVYVIDTGRIVFSGSWSEFDAHRNDVERYLAL